MTRPRLLDLSETVTAGVWRVRSGLQIIGGVEPTRYGVELLHESPGSRSLLVGNTGSVGHAVTPAPTKRQRAAGPVATVEVRIRLLRGLGVSPNERVHWAERSRRNADVRAAACVAALAVRPPVPLDHVTVALEVVWPFGARRRDTDNLLAALKPCVDGLVDGKVIVSDAPGHCTLLPPVQLRDRRAQVPVVIVRINSKEPQPQRRTE